MPDSDFGQPLPTPLDGHPSPGRGRGGLALVCPRSLKRSDLPRQVLTPHAPRSRRAAAPELPAKSLSPYALSFGTLAVKAGVETSGSVSRDRSGIWAFP